MGLVPVSDAGYVVLAFEQPSVVNADLLDRNFQILLEKNGIRKVPAVKLRWGIWSSLW